MKKKYLLSGRLISDIIHFRKLIDSWPDNIKFPEVIEDFKNIKLDDTVITMGYLGQSYELIKIHNPNKVFILDNAIFPVKGITNFRLLNGNLQTLIKNHSPEEQLNKSFYRKNLLDKLSTFEFDSNFTNSNQKHKNSDKRNIVEFPWSIPIKKLIQLKDKEAINLYNEEIDLIKNENHYTFYESFKDGAIKKLTKNNIPLLRIKNKNKIDAKTLFNCEFLFCPTSTMALDALIMQKKLIMSKYNPFYNYLDQNDSYKNYNEYKLIETLITYIGNLNFSISDVFNYICS